MLIQTHQGLALGTHRLSHPIMKDWDLQRLMSRCYLVDHDLRIVNERNLISYSIVMLLGMEVMSTYMSHVQ